MSLLRRHVDQATRPRGELVRVAWLEQVARLPIVDQGRDAAAVAADHRHAARHRFEHDEAERLRIGWHHKDVGGGEGARELLALQQPGEHGGRAWYHTLPSLESSVCSVPWLFFFDALAVKVLAQAVHVRTLTHKRQPSARQLGEHVAQVAQPLLDAQAADVDEEGRLWLAARQPLAHLARRRRELGGVVALVVRVCLAPPRLCAVLRVEDVRVDALVPNLHALYAMRLELRLHLGRRHHRQVGAVVQLSDHTPRQPLSEPAQPPSVRARVDGDVSVVRHYEWHVLPLAGDVRRHVRDEAGGGDVDQVRLKLVDHLRHRREARQLVLAPRDEPIPRPQPPPQALAHALDGRDAPRKVDLLIEREAEASDRRDRVAEEVLRSVLRVVGRNDGHLRPRRLLVLEVLLEAVRVA
mmetsp:Transcript_12578/g.40110  ORF Transcript_12578/g.40110 Transcript_12578/m.40110 type:complete len:411 (-) Transcript_12578:210-1442(-)